MNEEEGLRLNEAFWCRHGNKGHWDIYLDSRHEEALALDLLREISTYAFCPLCCDASHTCKPCPDKVKAIQEALS